MKQARKADASKPTFFASPTAFRRWLEKHHDSETELWVGFHKKATGRPSITWSEAVDQALCFGWIDGIRKSVDADSYMNRFTPRKRGSIWSAVNTRRAQELIEAGLMRPPGMQAFEGRDVEKSNRQASDRENAAFDAAQLRQFRANRKAWEFFQAQPPGYRKMMAWYVQSAKQDATRTKRLAALIAQCAAGRRIESMQRKQPE